MNRAFVGLFVLVALTGCASTEGGGDSLAGGVPFTAKYKVVVDKSRTAEVTVKGEFAASTSVRDAEPGEAETLLKSIGKITIKNPSKDRAISDGEVDHVIDLALPYEACAASKVFRSVAKDFGISGGVVCTTKVLEIEQPTDIEPGKTYTHEFNQHWEASNINENQAKAWVKAAKASPQVANEMVVFNPLPDSLNKTCTYKDQDGKTVNRISLWSSDPTIDSCSTEPNR